MVQTRESITNQLIKMIARMPFQMLMQLFEYASGLLAPNTEKSTGATQYQITSTKPKRGSAEAILQSIDEVGPLEFEPGELDRILDELREMRHMDREDYGLPV